MRKILFLFIATFLFANNINELENVVKTALINIKNKNINNIFNKYVCENGKIDTVASPYVTREFKSEKGWKHNFPYIDKLTKKNITNTKILKILEIKNKTCSIEYYKNGKYYPSKSKHIPCKKYKIQVDIPNINLKNLRNGKSELYIFENGIKCWEPFGW